MSGLEPDVARVSGGGKKIVVEKVWREPEVTSRDVSEVGSVVPPAAVKAMRKLAEGEGWRVDMTYARGDLPPTSQSDGKLTHSLALKMERGSQVAIGCWIAPGVDGDGVRNPVEGLTLLGPLGGVVGSVERPGLKWSFDAGFMVARYTCERTGVVQYGWVKLNVSELKARLTAL